MRTPRGFGGSGQGTGDILGELDELFQCCLQQVNKTESPGWIRSLKVGRSIQLPFGGVTTQADRLSCFPPSVAMLNCKDGVLRDTFRTLARVSHARVKRLCAADNLFSQ